MMVAVQGSSVQVVQEKILRQHGIKWRQLKVTMVRSTLPSKQHVVHLAFPKVPQEPCSHGQAHTEAAQGCWRSSCLRLLQKALSTHTRFHTEFQILTVSLHMHLEVVQVCRWVRS